MFILDKLLQGQTASKSDRDSVRPVGGFLESKEEPKSPRRMWGGTQAGAAKKGRREQSPGVTRERDKAR